MLKYFEPVLVVSIFFNSKDPKPISIPSTTRKLFCNCKSILRKDEPDYEIRRRLHAVAGESGKIDVAVKYQTSLDKEFIYQTYDTTCLVELDEDTIIANARFFNSIDDVPKKAISMGIRNIMHSKKIVLLANGEQKAIIIKEMLFGPVTPIVPASILQLHNDVTIILDQTAAKEIISILQKK
jgi:hypothetical protein